MFYNTYFRFFRCRDIERDDTKGRWMKWETEEQCALHQITEISQRGPACRHICLSSQHYHIITARLLNTNFLDVKSRFVLTNKCIKIIKCEQWFYLNLLHACHDQTQCNWTLSQRAYTLVSIFLDEDIAYISGIILSLICELSHQGSVFTWIWSHHPL